MSPEGTLSGLSSQTEAKWGIYNSVIHRYMPERKIQIEGIIKAVPALEKVKW